MTNYRFIRKELVELTLVQGVQSSIHTNICTQLLNLLYEQRNHSDYRKAKKIINDAQKVGLMYKDTSRIERYAQNNNWADILTLLKYVNQGIDTLWVFEGDLQDCINEDEEISDPSESDF